MIQRRGYSEWVKLIEEFEKSGSSLEDFGAKLGVKPSALQFWFYQLRKQASRAPRFLPVDVVASAAPMARQAASETVELALASGALLRFSIGADLRASRRSSTRSVDVFGAPKSVGIYWERDPCPGTS